MTTEEQSPRRVVVQSNLVDDMLTIGIAADALAAVTVNSDIEVRIVKGRIEIGNADCPDIIIAGVRGAEPSADNWRMAQALLARSGLGNRPK